MRRILTLSIVAVMSFSLSAQSPEGTSIVGGTAVTNGDYLFMATLLQPGSSSSSDLSNEFFCGGSLIDDEWVLTAAHCLQDPFTQQALSASQVAVGFDIYALENPNGGWIYRTVDTVIIHPDYAQDDNADIGLIKLSQPITTITPVDIPTSAADTVHEQIGTSLRNIGFGSNFDPNINPNFHQSDTLLYVDVNVISVDSAKGLHQDYAGLTHRVIPTLGPDPVQDRSPCFGDSGGPLFNLNGGNPVQVGVVSWGVYCGDADYAAVFARVSEFSSWINSHINTISVKENKRIMDAFIAGQILHMNSTFEDGISALRIVDVMGREVANVKPNSAEADLSFLNTGYYIVSIERKGEVIGYLKHVAP